MNGAATNPDAHVVAYAAAQVKKGLEVAKKLGAQNYGMDKFSWITCPFSSCHDPLIYAKECKVYSLYWVFFFSFSILGWKRGLPESAQH